ncbi:MAG: DUF2723 domain-containing protein [Bacteroidales bacterium]|jgi:hypothetical protein|nr:DUF2723 domain-containing protein [Bacteroidales bacterium]
MLRNYKVINNALGWGIFIIASLVYIFTAEPTVSFWDCGEYIATAYKLQVGHPPGAPTFQLIGKIATMFAGGDVTKVAFAINCMSAICSGFTILFLFWSLTMLAKKVALSKGGQLTNSNVLAIFGSAVVGSLAYTFSDTFWFSAVEGEVYAMSSFCTALVFWAILKWEQVADDNYSNRWIILIAYIIGLSIGVHLLNLLTLPAMALVVYFKKYKSTTKGTIVALLISFAMVAVILWGIIPGVVKYSGVIERMFTNSFNTGFYVGTIVFFVILAGLLVWGLWYSESRRKKLLNLGFLSLVFLLIGYSTFLMLPIRANANTPISENDPEDAVSLLSYLNREQYGSTPFLYGQYYNTPVKDRKDGTPAYMQKYVVIEDINGMEDKLKSCYTEFEAQKFIETYKATAKQVGNIKIEERYEIGDPHKGEIPVYEGSFCTLFPRMWNTESDHVNQYRNWAGIAQGSDYEISGGRQVPKKIEFSKNLKFFLRYQMGYMYFRYFMWNFVGRQTLNQGRGAPTEGEWISGINFIDDARLGPQDKPDFMKDTGNNKYFFLPLILGLIGLFFHFSRDKKNGLVTLTLFFMTGIAIGIYLNMYAYQPRERDYAFAASFYVFAMWIGMGVYAVYTLIQKYLNKYIKPSAAAITATIVCLGVPALMASQNWDDHDRSKRFLTLTIAKSYLDACAPNAILFANGDNDTFPLWYLQEVEGYRTDVRICNLSLMATDWYIDQAKRKVYNGEPVPVTMTKELYQQGTRDLVVAYNRIKEPQNAINVMDEICKPVNNRREAIINTTQFYMDVDKEKVLKNNVVDPKFADRIVDRMYWSLPARNVYQAQGGDTIMIFNKAYLAMFDIIAHNNWERPIYYVGVTGNEPFFGLENYTQIEGIVHRLVPIYTPVNEGNYFPPYFGFINTDILYNNLINKYDYSQYADKKIFLSEDYNRQVTTFKAYYTRLAEALVAENKPDTAIKVLDDCYKIFPLYRFPTEYLSELDAVRIYISTKKPEAVEKGLKLCENSIDQLTQQLNYYLKFKGSKAQIVDSQRKRTLAILEYYNRLCLQFKGDSDEQYAPKWQTLIDKTQMYTTS